MSEEEIYVLPDGDTVVFSPNAHNYALAEYGALEPHFDSYKSARSLLYDLQRDTLLTVTEDRGRFSVRENGLIPKEFTNRMTTISDLEESLLEDKSCHKKPETDDESSITIIFRTSLTEMLRLYGLISYN